MECRRNVKRCLYLPALRSGGIDQPKTRPRTINPMRPFQLPKLLVLFPLAMHLAVVSASCQGINPGAARAAPPQNIKWDPFLDTLQERINRSEEHTSELQSHSDLVCRLLLVKTNTNPN